jgi:hypothetical protein
MGLFGGSFGKGLLTGLAGGIERGVQGSIDRHMDDLSNSKKYMRERRNQEEARYRKDLQDYKDTIEDLARYVDKSSLPEGATAYDVAGAYLESSLGGSLREGQAAVEELRKSKLSYGEDSAMLMFDKANQMGLTAEDLSKQFTKPVDFDFIKGGEQKGTGLFFKNVDIRDKAAKSVTMPVEEQMSEIQLGTAKTKGKFATREAQEKADTLTDFKIKQAQADYRKSLTDANLEDAMSFTEYKGQITTNVQDVLRPYDIPVDADGNFSLKTAKQQVSDLSSVWTDIVKNSVDQANTAVGTLADKGNLSQILAKASLRDQGGKYVIGTQTISEGQALQPGIVYELVNQGTNEPEFHLYLGEEYGKGSFVPLYGQD